MPAPKKGVADYIAKKIAKKAVVKVKPKPNTKAMPKSNVKVKPAAKTKGNPFDGKKNFEYSVDSRSRWTDETFGGPTGKMKDERKARAKRRQMEPVAKKAFKNKKSK
jgi:hypothetical protein